MTDFQVLNTDITHSADCPIAFEYEQRGRDLTRANATSRYRYETGAGMKQVHLLFGRWTVR